MKSGKCFAVKKKTSNFALQNVQDKSVTIQRMVFYQAKDGLKGQKAVSPGHNIAFAE